ncbi:MAG: type II toxin-antitoxin system VapC family toxin [Candidatus Kerfeldbacteria bacterium]|nr:type II toxin-antitoxin system VapC family toxin [Candidatus Kerfeldbacteria bacterium]
MARIFLDANIFIDLVEQRGVITSKDLKGHDLFISPLSVHILMYVTKKKIPYSKLAELLQLFLIIPFEQAIIHKALRGPMDDFEDNIQLHSAAMADCNLFLTHDKKLLQLSFFGKTQLTSAIP